MTHEKLVRDFFSQHAKSPLPNGKDAFPVHYLDDGLIDSFGIVTMIDEFESELGVSFSAEDMQSYEFQTVGGLIGILERLVGGPS
ncbi:MAG: acyl carrier protein [Mesorhizobium sp.]|nr:MAG: acyl carrier protein [Mesorhizobium sp.]